MLLLYSRTFLLNKVNVQVITIEILRFPFLGALLREYANKYKNPREKLIVLVHWTFLIQDFLISKGDENKDIIDWIKEENDSIDIIYFHDNLVIEAEQYFDNENFYIRLKMDENIQSSLQMSINDHID
ncbi:unnamed protein product [Rotaria magnacalcarata]|uniref:Uncharacterized protein n=1 Tax=Rotaria magnacalcarata TaxID=392030 RepID=A0A814PI89_9BILA|nr:unnamed protein product [Rotaria magnacalcarata]CAF1649040.1 unnamed protein product [Rotaria magnacalcarata]CAF4472283.1 unnamed protein product [Rotaria magnacalcarata]CAF4521025.1 unnamed protein product [Rotaria magnacalcarata]